MSSAKAQDRLATLKKNLKIEKNQKIKADNSSETSTSKRRKPPKDCTGNQPSQVTLTNSRRKETQIPVSNTEMPTVPLKSETKDRVERKTNAQMRLKMIGAQKKSEKYAKVAAQILAKVSGKPHEPPIPTPSGPSISKLPKIPKKPKNWDQKGQGQSHQARPRGEPPPNPSLPPPCVPKKARNVHCSHNCSETRQPPIDLDCSRRTRVSCKPVIHQDSSGKPPAEPPLSPLLVATKFLSPLLLKSDESKPCALPSYAPRKTCMPGNPSAKQFYHNNWLEKGTPSVDSEYVRRKPRHSYSEGTCQQSSSSIQQRLSHPLTTSRSRQNVTKTSKATAEASKESMSYVRASLTSFNQTNLTQQLQDVRTLVEPVEMMDCDIVYSSFETELEPPVSSDLYIVIDTNVIINELPLIKNLKSKTLRGMTPKIIVPWQVLKELDYLKNDKYSGNLHFKARKGIQYILEEIVKGDGFINGQPQMAASRGVDNFIVEVPDDHLVKCGLQLKSSGHNVILLSEDKNLVLKSIVCGVTAMKPPELRKIGETSEGRFSCLEMPPPRDLGLCRIAAGTYRVFNLLRNFLSAILKKFWMYKYNNCWLLYSPGPEPWALSYLLDTINQVWSELIPDPNLAYTKKAITDLQMFLNKNSYDKLKYADLEHIGRTCHSVALSLMPSFRVEAESFDASLIFLKCSEEMDLPANTNFQKSCALLTVHHVHLFENKIVQYCYSVAQRFSIPFNYPKIGATFKDGASDLAELPLHYEVADNIGKAMSEISSVEAAVNAGNPEVKTLYLSLVTYLRDSANPLFVVEDVVEFCNDLTFRKSFPDALQELKIISSFLELIRQTIGTPSRG